MKLNITRPDLEVMIRNMVNHALDSLSIEQKLEALEWFISIIEEIQDNVE